MNTRPGVDSATARADKPNDLRVALASALVSALCLGSAAALPFYRDDLWLLRLLIPALRLLYLLPFPNEVARALTGYAVDNRELLPSALLGAGWGYALGPLTRSFHRFRLMLVPAASLGVAVGMGVAVGVADRVEAMR